MLSITKSRALPRSLALAGSLALSCAAAPAAATVAPLPRSEYAVRRSCVQPAQGRAACMSLKLVPQTQRARARNHPLGMVSRGPLPALSAKAGDFGLRPQDLHSAYQLPEEAPSSPQTIALVDAYNDPTAAADLKAYDEEFGLAACTVENGCFEQVNQRGETANLPFPKTSAELESARGELAKEATGWDLEISLDVEAAHATCPSCRIVLVEASSPSFEDLEAAESAAIALGAKEVSNSWGGPERGVSASLEASSPFNHPGTVVTVAAGDDGYLDWDSEFERGYADFPASSPHVVAVGGTRLSLGVGGGWSSETVWNGDGAGGGGCSVVFPAPLWQQDLPNWASVGCGGRAVGDVSADADPYSGLAVYDTSPICEEAAQHWCTIGGTSLSSPVIAAVYALAGGAGGVAYPARTAYAKALAEPGSVHDIASGSNGECAAPFQEPSLLSSCSVEEEARSCSARAICKAGTGYDGPSGIGSPHGIAAFQAPAGGESELPPLFEPRPREEPASAPSSPPPAAPAPAGSAPVASAPAPSATPVISAFGLTTAGVIALNRRHPRLSQVAFAFTISAPARVRVSIDQRRRVHGRVRWVALRGSLTLNAHAGRNGGRLRGRRRLAAGAYRLLATPVAGGGARTTTFHIY